VTVGVDPLRAIGTRHREREVEDRDGLAERGAGADGYHAGVISQILAVVTVDYDLPDERVEFSLTQLAHAMRLTVHSAGGAPFRGLPLV
jgi:hypothetical protein